MHIINKMQSRRNINKRVYHLKKGHSPQLKVVPYKRVLPFSTIGKKQTKRFISFLPQRRKSIKKDIVFSLLQKNQEKNVWAFSDQVVPDPEITITSDLTVVSRCEESKFTKGWSSLPLSCLATLTGQRTLTEFAGGVSGRYEAFFAGYLWQL